MRNLDVVAEPVDDVAQDFGVDQVVFDDENFQAHEEGSAQPFIRW